eukprot:1161047-Pelagomonas_calceolata.AAC.52
MGAQEEMSRGSQREQVVSVRSAPVWHGLAEGMTAAALDSKNGGVFRQCGSHDIRGQSVEVENGLA